MKTQGGVEAVEAVGYENYIGTLYGYANHKNYADNPGAIPVRIIREADYQALRTALTASERLLEIGVQKSAIKDCGCQVCLDWITDAEAILQEKAR